MDTDVVALTPFGEGVWLGTDPIRFLGLRLTAAMAVLRLGDGSLLVYAPVALTPERRSAVDSLGRVAHLYAPSLYHHRWVGEWSAAHPSARLHAPSGLARKRRDLRVDRVPGASPEPAFADAVDELHIGGFRLDETVLFHRALRTLVVADLVHNVGRPEHGFTRRYTRAMGFYDRVALSRALRWTAFFDGAAARRDVDRVLACPFERLVVGHGAPLEVGARETLSGAYRWLPQAR
jgi:hypothetical protein